MTVPDGFRVTLFAGEPDVVQPIAMAFDDRGRLWVVECLSYPNWSKDGKGKDRVLILEDTDGDGTFDKRTVFLDNGVNLSGIELGFGGVWLCSSPNLVFVPVKDGEDRPAGPPEVVLDGWNVKDTKHNVFNSLAWGPDGWLYGCNGIQAKARVGRPGTPDKDRVPMDCGVWRYHPTRKVFEVYANGTTNPWGLDWDDYGQMFITNCVIDHIWHVVPGGHYQRMYGQDLNPYVFDLMTSCADHRHWAGGSWTDSRSTGVSGGDPRHSDAGGGHAHSGCCVYLGDNFPPEYRNSAFMCNIHGNRLNRDTLHRTAGGYVAKHARDFLFANDPWFRGICVKTGPDGGLYVSDWTDTGECHNYDKADTTNGRIYKVVYGTPKPWHGDLSKLSDAELVKLQLHTNDWFVRKARRILQERAAAGKLEEKTEDALRAIARNNTDETRQLRVVWALHAIGKLRHAEYGVLPSLLGSDGTALTAWLALLSVDPPSKTLLPLPLRMEVSAMASPSVRIHLASVMQRLPDPDKFELAKELFRYEADNADPNLSLMYWYGIQPAVLTSPKQSLTLAGRVKNGRVTASIVRLYLTRPGVDLPAALADVVSLLGKSSDPARKRIMAGTRLALAGRRDLSPPAGWNEVGGPLLESHDPGIRAEAEALAVTFGDPVMLVALRARLTDPAKPAAVRVAALELLLTRKPADFAPILRSLLDDPAVRPAAIKALAAYPDAETPAAILKHYPSFTAAEKADAVQTLASRPKFALALLDAVGAGTVPKSDITVFAARQIQALNDKAVSDRLAKVWGTVRPASATRKAQAAKYKKLLTPEALKIADLSHGRALFVQHCASCHKLFGEGGDVGPELTGSQRANLDYVLENVLDPSAVVPGEYRMTAFALLDGRTLTGIVRKETPQAVTVRTVNDELTVPVGDIDTRKQTPLSIMPDGLFDALKDDEVRDLVAYLASPRQVPLPARP